MSRKGLLIILDGYGEGEPSALNAVANAKTPYLKHIKKNCPNTLLYTHGAHVGLGDGMMGGSEVGHQNIGAGRVIKSVLFQINQDIKSGTFLENKFLYEGIAKAAKSDSSVHLIGLFSDKNIHSDINHMFQIMHLSKDLGIKKLFVHAITDGRDSAVDASEKYFVKLSKVIKDLQLGEVASVGGRFFAMDREQNWERTKQGFNAMFFENDMVDDALTYVKEMHAKNVSDENIVPKKVKTQFSSYVGKNDCLIFFNFREDRMRQLLTVAEEQLMDKISVLTMTDYSVKGSHAKALYFDENIKGTLSEYISSLGLRQLKISETTKYAHVTYFLNGRREAPFKNEDRIHIPTLKVADFASKPAMRAKEIAATTIKAIKSNEYNLIIVNFSNPDMIGHTANYHATVKALEILDKLVKNITETANKQGYVTIITADHGNAEQLRDKNNNLFTAHTLNPVMFAIVDNSNKKLKMAKSGALCDVAPTLLSLMELLPNPKFEGKILYTK